MGEGRKKARKNDKEITNKYTAAMCTFCFSTLMGLNAPSPLFLFFIQPKRAFYFQTSNTRRWLSEKK